MRGWLPRGLWTGVLHGGVQVGTGAVAVHSPGGSAAARYAALGLVVVVGVVWGALDSRRGLDEGGLVWFSAALVAGPVAGVVGVLGRSLLVDRTGVEALGPALTGGAAFTALLVLVAAGPGLALGRVVPRPRRSS
ncbi:B-4DMT family transporter [Saccharothrix australiensis]|uniref:Uncharacterized protein n=1 Tax=Saccharothrix australiensis TaxID=2072 RepID=A0A495W5L3_9PSEU|nr:B-4DMT family transporter [Saccharothrix australiensis]RKT56410.1 hypothetical protein C8E97_5109 [Saccharothrix australiensis]